MLRRTPPPLRLTGASDHEGGGRLTSELIKQTILPKCVQVLKRRRPWSVRVRQHGPRAAGRRPTIDVSDRTGGDPPRRRRAPDDVGLRREPRPPRGRAETYGRCLRPDRRRPAKATARPRRRRPASGTRAFGPKIEARWAGRLWRPITWRRCGRIAPQTRDQWRNIPGMYCSS